MIKGHSYICYDDRNVSHPIVKALHARGIINIDLVYGSHWSTDAGWTILNSSIGAVWLGYTKQEALKNIQLLYIGNNNPDRGHHLLTTQTK